MFPFIQSQSWLTEGGKNLASFTSHLFQAARTPTVHTGLRLHEHAYNAIISSSILIITGFINNKESTQSLLPRDATRPYRTRYSWWSDLPWLDARCVHLFSKYRLDPQTFTFSRASSAATLYAHDAVHKKSRQWFGGRLCPSEASSTLSREAAASGSGAQRLPPVPARITLKLT